MNNECKTCDECGRILPRRAYRATCATCRKPPEQRVHMRAIFNQRQLEKRRQEAYRRMA
ncbi:MAG: hypothetical protein ACXWP0_13620 [Ktedonobacterales bacterium]